MFWFIVLPFSITCFIAFSAIFYALFKFRKKNSIKPLFVSFLLISVLFIPSCIVINIVIDSFRFGIFKIDNGLQLQNGQTNRRIPESANNITIDLQYHGFSALYSIKQYELELFYNRQWESWGENSKNVRVRKIITDPLEVELANNSSFSKYGWNLNGPIVFLTGPRGANGKGYDIWYSQADSMAIQVWSYW